VLLEIETALPDRITLRLPEAKSECQGKFDGKPYPVLLDGAASKRTSSFEKLGEYSFRVMNSMQGKPLHVDLFTLSEDGQTLTIDSKPVAADGRQLIGQNIGFFEFAPDENTVLVWAHELKDRFLLHGYPLALCTALDRIAFAGGANLGGEDQDQLYLLETDGDRVELIGRHPERIDHIAFSPDGQIIAASGGSVGALLWNASARSQANSSSGSCR
jgi:WD40 repeat protein